MPKFGSDPMAAGSPSPFEGGLGDDAMEAHMKAFTAAHKAGDPRGMATALRAALDAWYDDRETPVMAPREEPAPPL